MKKKLIVIVPVLIMLVLNVLFNGIWTDKAVEEREKATQEATVSPSPSVKPSPSPAPTPKPTPTPTPTPSPTPDPQELLRQESQRIADYALNFWGANYKYGGDSLEEGGFDCSGLVYHCYGMAGYKLERVAAQQAKQGIEVPPDQLQPGDVLCFHKSGGYVGHVGIYVGNNHYIHAMGEAYGVVVTALDNPDLPRTFTTRRYVGCEELKIQPEEAPAA